MTRTIGLLAGVCVALAAPRPVTAFCGFFAGKAGADLYNSASQVVIVHDAGKTVLTMVNDFRCSPEDFALVVPVPVVIERDVVRVADMAVVDRLDAYSAPRLAEYHDPNPCAVKREAPPALAMQNRAGPRKSAVEELEAPVRVEASYAVGEYDIVVLSSAASRSLDQWLRQNGYAIPPGAEQALRPYVRSGMKFFVAKVNVDRASVSGFQKLRPLQFAFPDPRFMLPVRLGMLNADGPQDLIAYVISRGHRVEPANYRSLMMPANKALPTFTKQKWPDVYRAIFDRQVEATRGRAVFTEYAWDMGACDPCASPPLRPSELQALGVWWVGQSGPSRAYVTRLHARYTGETFPEDLRLKTTRDRSSFQARYVLRHPYLDPVQCEEASAYFREVVRRRGEEVEELAELTGWSREAVTDQMTPLPHHFSGAAPTEPDFLDRIRDCFAE